MSCSRYHCTIRHRECGCNRITSTGVLWSTPIFALLIPGHDLFYILEAHLKSDSSCKFQLILYRFHFGKIIFQGQCILGPERQEI